MATPNPKIILPEPSKRNVLITSALPYVNNVPHLGNLIGSVLSADVFARYCRARSYPTIYVCGTDEYGTTTEAKALFENCTPRELCDKYHKIHAEIYQWFNISFDVFGRTTNEHHEEIIQKIFLKLYNSNFLEERTTTQLFCPKHESYLADRFVVGECPSCGYQETYGDQCDAPSCGQLLDPLELRNPRCKIDGAEPIRKETDHMFLELDKLQPAVETFFKDSVHNGAWSSNGTNITSAWLRTGLKPRSITRDIKWGTKVPLPGYQNKVIYSWFDACIGYISITACYTGQWEKWWRNPEVELYQFIGKDNVSFHSVMFPASLIGTGETWTKLHHLSTTEYLNYEGGKFSKSRGVGVFGDTASRAGIDADIWRFYLLSHRPENSDSEFNWSSFVASNNEILINNFGNFINRVLKFVNSTYAHVIPDYDIPPENKAEFEQWIGEVNGLLKQYNHNMTAVKLRAGLDIVLRISSLGNRFLQSNKLGKALAEENTPKCNAIVGFAVNLIHLLAALIAPFMPKIAETICGQLSVEPMSIPDIWEPQTIRSGHSIGQAKPLFKRITQQQADDLKERFGVKAGEEMAEPVGKKAVNGNGKIRETVKPEPKREST